MQKKLKELELLIQTHMTQKHTLRVEVGVLGARQVEIKKAVGVGQA